MPVLIQVLIWANLPNSCSQAIVAERIKISYISASGAKKEEGREAAHSS